MVRELRNSSWRTPKSPVLTSYALLPMSPITPTYSNPVPSLMLEETHKDPALHPPAGWRCLLIDALELESVCSLTAHHSASAAQRVGTDGSHCVPAQPAGSDRSVKPWSCATGLQNAGSSRTATSTGWRGLKLPSPPTQDINCEDFLIGNCTTLLVNW